MSRLRRETEMIDGSKPCSECGIADKNVLRWYFPDALPTDPYYGKEGFSHPEEGCVEPLKAELSRLRGAIGTHKRNIWGNGPVGHEEDTALYAALQGAPAMSPLADFPDFMRQTHLATPDCPLYCEFHGNRSSHPCCHCHQHELDTALGTIGEECDVSSCPEAATGYCGKTPLCREHELRLRKWYREQCQEIRDSQDKALRGSASGAGETGAVKGEGGSPEASGASHRATGSSPASSRPAPAPPPSVCECGHTHAIHGGNEEGEQWCDNCPPSVCEGYVPRQPPEGKP